ncbi:MAG TPA: hypothetical protein VKF41_00410, partial [Bryobacteraceae bacterium]|nr:hypothetical protein [Bryobacteraceae bacterium]
MPAGSQALLDRLDSWKSRFGPPENGDLPRLLTRIARTRFGDPADLVRVHETVLFLRAHPRTPAVARLADSILASTEGRVGALRAAGRDLSPLEDPEVSGIAGTGLSAVFSYEVARRLAALHPNLEIDWEAFDQPDRAGPVARRFIPLLAEEWPVEAHPPFRRWLEAAQPRGRNGLRFLLERIAALPLDEGDRGDLYDGLQVPLRWSFSDAARSRSRLTLDIRPRRPLYCHKQALIERRDVSLADHLQGPPLSIRHVPEREAGRILDLILESSAMRYRELYGFSHPDVGRVFHAD